MHISAAADALDMGYRARPPHPQCQLPTAFKEHRPNGEGRKKHNIVDMDTRSIEKASLGSSEHLLLQVFLHYP